MGDKGKQDPWHKGSQSHRKADTQSKKRYNGSEDLREGGKEDTPSESGYNRSQDPQEGGHII